MNVLKLIIIIFLISLGIFIKIGRKEIIYVKSDIDGKRYLVREMKDKQRAANMLARMNKNIKKLVIHLTKYKDTKYKAHKAHIEQLERNTRQMEISESDGESSYTSYSVNKGEQIIFCLRSKMGERLHERNMVMYVCLHELAHVGCPEYGHTKLFKKIFAFFTNVAIEQGIYKKINFREEPKEYCGLTITESII